MDVRDISLPDMEIYGAAAVGPGLGVDEDSYLITEKILRGYSGPVVIRCGRAECTVRVRYGLGYA